jgi:hypothetical protein
MAQAVPGCRKSIPLQPGVAIFLYFCIVVMAISHKLSLKSHKANGPCCNQIFYLFVVLMTMKFFGEMAICT